MANDWNNCVSEESAARMNAAHIDRQLRKLGNYSHLIQFTNVDGRPRQIKCHARHVDEHMAALRKYGCEDARVTEL